MPTDRHSQSAEPPAEALSIEDRRRQLDHQTVKIERTQQILAVRRERLMDKRDLVRSVRALSLVAAGGLGLVSAQASFFAQYFAEAARLVAHPAVIPAAVIIGSGAGVALVGAEVGAFTVRRRLRRVRAERGLCEQKQEAIEQQRRQLDSAGPVASRDIEGHEANVIGGPELGEDTASTPPARALGREDTPAQPLDIFPPARPRSNVDAGRGLELDGPGPFR